MKHAAMTLRALRSPFVVGFLVGVGAVCYYIWHPLMWMYMGIVAINMLNVVVTIGIGSLTRGRSTVRAEISAAIKALDDADAADAAARKARIEANLAKLRDSDKK
jgi:membrane protein required for beta-lactamase induction